MGALGKQKADFNLPAMPSAAWRYDPGGSLSFPGLADEPAGLGLMQEGASSFESAAIAVIVRPAGHPRIRPVVNAPVGPRRPPAW